VSFTLYDLHKMDNSIQIKKTEHRLQKLSTTQKKQTTQNTAKHNYPGSVAFYHTQPGNVCLPGLFYGSQGTLCCHVLPAFSGQSSSGDKDRLDGLFRKAFKRGLCSDVFHIDDLAPENI